MEDQINKVTAQLGLDRDVVEKAIRSQFGFTKELIEQGNLESVHLHFIGKWAVKPKYSVIPDKEDEYNNNS